MGLVILRSHLSLGPRRVALHYGTVLGDEFRPSFLSNLLAASKRSAMSPKKLPVVQLDSNWTSLPCDVKMVSIVQKVHTSFAYERSLNETRDIVPLSIIDIDLHAVFPSVEIIRFPIIPVFVSRLRTVRPIERTIFQAESHPCTSRV